MTAFDDLPGTLSALERRGLYRRRRVVEGPQGREVMVDGRRLLNFCSNDYLGLAADEAVVTAAREALAYRRFGSGASPLVTGRGQWHARLEREIASFEGTQAALLIPSGYAANCGTIAALVGKPDAVFSDELNHASIVDGCRLSGAAIHVYRHGDAAHLTTLLEASAARRKLTSSDTRIPVA